MPAIVRRHFRLFTIDQQIKHMRLYGTVHNGKIFAVEERVENRHFQCRGPGDRGFARFQIDLHAELFREGFQARAERIDRIIFAGKVNAAAKADPFNTVEKRTEFFFNIAQHTVEQAEIGIFAIIMDHKTGDAVHDLFNLRHVPFAKAAERARRIGKIEAR
ncbi:hypothetical protein BCH_02872 [Brucella sp. 191011898]|nr:hypothetical protein BCH_02872 [Brucella sp. 191011898]